jgi:Zn-dependent peptidase ImmA (M78 family)
MTKRDAILDGTQAAQRLHAALGTRKAIESGAQNRIDVFRVAMDRGALLLFRPLKGLLGAYLGQPNFPRSGIIVSTQRDLHVQRFTAAHELGHMTMNHAPSLDGEEIGLWRGESSDPQEVEADAFASEFLLPRWLYIHHASRQQWAKRELSRPDIVYQMSLRLGASYDATCWGLQGHGIVDRSVADKLRAYEPKELKNEALRGRGKLANPWADVWVISEADTGLTFEGSPDDIVIFRCKERAAAGYLWDEAPLREGGFELLVDTREIFSGDEIGAAVTRVIVARVPVARHYEVSLQERRPWQPEEPATQLNVAFDLLGKEQGLPRFAREMMAAA